MPVLVLIGQHLARMWKMIFARECFSCAHKHTHCSRHARIYTSRLCPELTDESFASIFEQSALASFSVEAMLFFKSMYCLCGSGCKELVC